MPRKANGSDGQPRDLLMRITSGDRERLAALGDGDPYAGLQRALSRRAPPPQVPRLASPPPAPAAPALKPQRYIPPPRGYVGKR